ncbi:Pectin lyase-like superfamily protein [Abeliophyllum distichum]|uniref:Pectin lyase-like superfamily protein n=1 Tax=Abeliophyllum distichum TaxID=126358 RepID=A0ABD1U3H6_9LAMI
MHKHNKQRNDVGNPPTPAPSPLPRFGANPVQSVVFNILSFGAKGDGVSDDSKALLAAWKTACKATGAVVEIPSEFKFVIKPITLQGPCTPHLVFQIDGTILAPPKVGSWPKSSLYQWIDFKWLYNFTIQGKGTVDGQGSNWWSSSQINPLQKKRSKIIPDMKPTALRFYASYNVTIRDIRIIDSPLCHLKFDNSEGVKINNITISAPESSPNTDGIHLQNTKDVEIQHSNIACGDDCVSIQTGCSNVHVHHISCGPGHGISLGGLGKDKSIACVSNINVENIVMANTLYGARIKTWQGGLGSVKNVTFSNIQLSEVKVPIMIDQYYCDKNICKNQTGAVAISGVKFDQIIGTYSVQPIHLACSNSVPCIDVVLIDIQLKPSPACAGIQQALCWNSYGKSQAPLVPSSIDYCVRSGNDLLKRISRSSEDRC